MSITSFSSGHKIEFVNGAWIYADDGTSADVERPCKRCGRMPTLEGYDACIGFIDGAVSACCGHGVHDPIIVMGEKRSKQVAQRDVCGLGDTMLQ